MQCDSEPCLKLHAYFNAGWACHTDMKGHSGMVLTLGILAVAPLPVYQDNTSSMKIATIGHGSSTSNTKFMDLKFQWLKQHIDSKIIVQHYLTTHDMIADFFASPRIGESC